MAHTLAPALTRLTANIGVEVHGLDLGRGLDDQVLSLLRTAVAEHHMVVLRDQHLSADQHAAVAIAFGPILPSPVQMATGARTVTVSNIEDTASRPPAGFPWHTDLSWTARPPAFGFLSAVTIPEFGGDTIWASTAATFDALPPDAREQCERSTLLHAPDPSLLASVERRHGTKVAERLRRDHPGVEHPLVTTHPITGRRSLFLSPLYARRIVGPMGIDGRVLNGLNSMLDDPHVQVRWRWSEGDFVIWDETSTCHRALTDHHPQRRVMRRCVTSAQ
jgi:taurine dioxygenase